MEECVVTERMEALLALPDSKRDAILAEFGDAAQPWINDFTQLVRTCAERWRLTLLATAAAGLPINVIYFAETADGEPVVLKVGYPHPEQRTEMIALSCYDGRYTPRLIDCSADLGATLMERIRPGTTFREWGSDIARSRVPMEILGAIPIRADRIEGLPTFESWLELAFAEFREKHPPDHVFYRHVVTAQEVFADVRAASPEDWLLHGDLHHENILLDAGRGWLAIDPKGVIGPRPLECGRFLHNFLEDEIEGAREIADTTVEKLCEVLDVRFATFADTLAMDRTTLARVNYIDCVLSFCWTINSHMPYPDTKPVEASRRMLD